MDSAFSNKRFAEDLKVTFPLLSDWKRDATKAYGLYDEARAFGRRATFVVDKEGIIQHVEVGNTAIDPTGALQVCNILDRKKAPNP